MSDIDFHRELLSRVRAIADNSIDPWASERLRAMAAEIERHLMQELLDRRRRTILSFHRR